MSRDPEATGFPPIARPDARVLILGSMPSIASLERQQYYGHARNAFWPVLCRLFGSGDVPNYPDRQALAQETGIAIWDVMASCRREGSLDSAIEADSIVPNDFAAFFDRHPRITHVFFNGAKAEQVFRRHVLPELGDWHLPTTRLPSTSPAMASLDLDAKTTAWQVVREAVEACTD